MKSESRKFSYLVYICLLAAFAFGGYYVVKAVNDGTSKTAVSNPTDTAKRLEISINGAIKTYYELQKGYDLDESVAVTATVGGGTYTITANGDTPITNEQVRVSGNRLYVFKNTLAPRAEPYYFILTYTLGLEVANVNFAVYVESARSYGIRTAGDNFISNFDYQSRTTNITNVFSNYLPETAPEVTNIQGT
jgi:hypothetical protein